jgi:HD-like signal output (HDOD) protein
MNREPSEPHKDGKGVLPTQVLLLDTGHGALAKLMPALQAEAPDTGYLLVNDPEAARELVARRDISIVVADFGADTGACSAFFLAIGRDKPGSIRVAVVPDAASLTDGFSNGGAHYCLSADSDARELSAVLERGRVVWERMQQTPRLAEILSGLDIIPTPPAMYFDIRDALEQESSTVQTIARLVERDPALAAKTLKVANSGFYALPRTVADLVQAIGLIGTDTVMALALSAHLFEHLPLPGVNLDKLWLHGLAISTLARFIAREEGGDRPTINASGVAGLLHDVGGLLLLANFPAEYQRVLRMAGGDETTLLELEQAHLGVGHPELGGLLLSLWNLPDEVVAAVAAHHAGDITAAKERGLVVFAVNIAEALLQDCHERDPGDDTESRLSGLAVLDQGKVSSWRNACPALLTACADGG